MPPRQRRTAPRAASRGQARPGCESLEVRTLLSGDPIAPLLTTPAPATPIAPAVATPATTTATATTTELVTPTTTAGTAIPTATTSNTPPAPTASPTIPPSPAPAPLPDLVAARIAGPSSLDWDQDFRLEGSILNQGGSATDAAFRVDVFASPTTKATSDSVPIGSFLVPEGVAAGSRYDFDVPLRTPGLPSAALTANPSYYVTLKVDTANAVAESNETNNAGRGLQGVDATMVTFAPRLPAKLVPAGIQVLPGQADWGGTIQVATTVRNEGPGRALPTNARIVLAPFGEDPFGPRSYTIGFVPLPEVLPHQTVSSTQSIELPITPPTALANVGKFTVMMISDADALNDPVFRAPSYQGIGLDRTTVNLTPRPSSTSPDQLPDLALTALSTPAAVAWSQTIEMKATLANVGRTDAGPFKVRFGLVQSDDPNAPMLTLADAFIGGLGTGRSQELVQSIRLPAQPPSGMIANSTTSRLVVRIDPDRSLDEARVDNNRLASPPVTLRVVSQDGTTSPPIITVTPTPITTPTPTNTPTPTPTKPVVSIPTPNRPTLPKPNPRRPVILPIQRRVQAPKPSGRQVGQYPNRPNLRIYPRPKQSAQHSQPAVLRWSQVRIMPVRPNGPVVAQPDRPA